MESLGTENSNCFSSRLKNLIDENFYRKLVKISDFVDLPLFLEGFSEIKIKYSSSDGKYLIMLKGVSDSKKNIDEIGKYTNILDGKVIILHYVTNNTLSFMFKADDIDCFIDGISSVLRFLQNKGFSINIECIDKLDTEYGKPDLLNTIKSISGKSLFSNLVDSEVDFDGMMLSGSGENFDDIVFPPDLMEKFNDLLLMLKNKKDLISFGGGIPKGFLLMGPRGVGKTMLMRVISGNDKIIVFKLDRTDYSTSLSNETTKRLKHILETIRILSIKLDKHVIIFLDEGDDILRSREEKNYVDAEEINIILRFMDGILRTETVTFFVSTNIDLDKIDPALIRPGRFSEIINVPMPDLSSRKELFRKKILKKLEQGSQIQVDGMDYEHFANETEGMSGDDIRDIIERTFNSVWLSNLKSEGKKQVVSSFHILKTIRDRKNKK